MRDGSVTLLESPFSGHVFAFTGRRGDLIIGGLR
jgi:hypothetical protein